GRLLGETHDAFSVVDFSVQRFELVLAVVVVVGAMTVDAALLRLLDLDLEAVGGHVDRGEMIRPLAVHAQRLVRRLYGDLEAIAQASAAAPFVQTSSTTRTPPATDAAGTDLAVNRPSTLRRRSLNGTSACRGPSLARTRSGFVLTPSASPTARASRCE